MTIISIHGDEIPQGEFYADAVMVGASFEECCAALAPTHAFAQDIGISERVDAYIDANGDSQTHHVTLYTLLGGSIR